MEKVQARCYQLGTKPNAAPQSLGGTNVSVGLNKSYPGRLVGTAEMPRLSDSLKCGGCADAVMGRSRADVMRALADHGVAREPSVQGDQQQH
jgi:hypothetical protein